MSTCFLLQDVRTRLPQIKVPFLPFNPPLAQALFLVGSRLGRLPAPGREDPARGRLSLRSPAREKLL